MVSAVRRSRKKPPEIEASSAHVCTEDPRRAPAPAHILSERFADPDLVDRIFDYIVTLLPEVASRRTQTERVIREEFASERVYIRAPAGTNGSSWNGEHPLAPEVARLFNGRNASEVARELGISRATVYRLLKQRGRK